MRALSHILVFAGLAMAGAGVYSVWTSREGERRAGEQWRKQLHQRPDRPAVKGVALARLSIDRLNGHWIVIEGADRAELASGPGHLIDSAMPGSRGNCVIAGHRDTQFRVLRKVEIGENISIERDGRTFLYRVTDRRVVAPTDTRSLDPTSTATLTLVTCYPFYYAGPAPKRFVVRAKLVAFILRQ